MRPQPTLHGDATRSGKARAHGFSSPALLCLSPPGEPFGPARVHSFFLHDPTPLNATLHRLRERAASAAARARVPYSRQPEAAALLLDDGRVVPGVRIESTSFPLTIPAATAALCLAHTLAPGRTVVAAAFTGDVPPDAEPLRTDVGLSRVETLPFALVRTGAPLPDVGDWAAPFLDAPTVSTPRDGIALARTVAARAVVPASNFPVGCVARLPDGRLVGSANVEVADWTRGLCAERILVATVAAYGLPDPDALYLTCLKASCSPCGGCRQVLMDQFPRVQIWMDRGDAAPAATTPPALLPGAFEGQGL